VTTVPDIGLLSFSRTSGILAAVAWRQGFSSPGSSESQTNGREVERRGRRIHIVPDCGRITHTDIGRLPLQFGQFDEWPTNLDRETLASAVLPPFTL
jgi:hypothetical protein